MVIIIQKYSTFYKFFLINGPFYHFLINCLFVIRCCRRAFNSIVIMWIDSFSWLFLRPDYGFFSTKCWIILMQFVCKHSKKKNLGGSDGARLPMSYRSFLLHFHIRSLWIFVRIEIQINWFVLHFNGDPFFFPHLCSIATDFVFVFLQYAKRDLSDSISIEKRWAGAVDMSIMENGHFIKMIIFKSFRICIDMNTEELIHIFI